MKSILLWDILENKVDMAKANRMAKKADKKFEKLVRDYGDYNNESITVKSAKELKKAIDYRYGTIIVEGSLAEKVSNAYKIKPLLDLKKAEDKIKQGYSAKAALLSSSTAALTGGEIVWIVAIVVIGVLIAIAMFKNYEPDVEVNVPGQKVVLKFKKAKDGN